MINKCSLSDRPGKVAAPAGYLCSLLRNQPREMPSITSLNRDKIFFQIRGYLSQVTENGKQFYGTVINTTTPGT
ncbi:hypothetical protein XELAEV_18034574mg [Xenopus laevis]|uniref:Uncharacterized protein n=1 Tax=Xenopus laevis TaxID=8355 RepID=A0A974HBN7_XENLA|nr:hypothetical protein XELAEV_18034574mg [Xenopus laevis]